jgi:hypothetical protein
MAERVISFLDSQPSDEIFLADELGDKLGISLSGLRANSIPGGRLALYMQSGVHLNDRKSPRPRTVWGNKKAIAALRRQVDANKNI